MKSIPVLLLFGWCSIAPAQVANNWINPSSAKWEAASSWSLGILPASNQTVNITNVGYKAVNIDGATVGSFSDSLTMSNLTISGPTNALSTLLLNYTGLSVTLRVLGGFEVDANGTLQNDNGSFEVDGEDGHEFLVLGGGQVIQDGGQTVANVPFNVFNGAVNCTNGNMTLGPMTLGDASHSGAFVQNGGSIAAYNIQMLSGGAYTLVNGTLYGVNGCDIYAAASLPATYAQYGGSYYGDMNVSLGNCVLHGGLMHGNTLTAGFPGNVDQQGGAVEMQTISLYGGSGNGPAYTLEQGQLYCGTLSIQANGLFEQTGGVVTLTNDFILRGDSLYVTNIEYANYQLVHGVLTAPSLSMGQYGTFHQSFNSTNRLTGGGLSITNTSYDLNDGWLETPYSGVGVGGTFYHQHGEHKINGVLSVTGEYDLTGGTVDASGFYLRGNLDAIYSTFNDYTVFSVTGLTDLGGTIHASTPEMYLGVIRLSTDSVITFSDLAKEGPGFVTCSNSAATAWASGQSLVLNRWHNGVNHIWFGTDTNGLSSAQLAQVFFQNPVGMSPGFYHAQILSNGEVVPITPPTLQSARYGANLVLTWPAGYQLLSATNLTGPYTPVSGATSPWTNAFTHPQEFFKLQGQ